MAAVHNNAADVVDIEIKGLNALSGRLRDPDDPLAQNIEAVVDLLASLKGRLIVTGVGKSGHVARKIAATLASTGSPSVFVHAGEASHGDLGMITRDDAVLALSNSGETSELKDIVAYTKRFLIPLIALTGNEHSALAAACDILLTLPTAEEACGAAPAPTTSTTMMLVLGDAIAVAAMGKKGFSAQDFKLFHPGGRLGAALTRATDLLHHKKVPLCEADASIEKVVATISEGGFGCVGVIDEHGCIIGMITDGDLRRHFQSPRGQQAGEIMTPSPTVATPDTMAGEVLALFSERKITAVFIVDGDGKPIGIVHVHDCLSTGVI